MHRLEQMRECLIACVQNQISGHLDQVDAKELGEAIDMIKDLDEAIYYRTITEAMKEDSEEKEKQQKRALLLLQQVTLMIPVQKIAVVFTKTLHQQAVMYLNSLIGHLLHIKKVIQA